MGKFVKEIAEKLNAILEKTYDAEKEFGKAAENAKSSSLAAWFTERALDRNRFAGQLKREIRIFGEDYKENGTLAGARHRAWMDVRALFSQNDDETMLEEAIRGEKAALEEYSDILKEQKLPPTTLALLTSQKAHIYYILALIMMTKDLDYERK